LKIELGVKQLQAMKKQRFGISMYEKKTLLIRSMMLRVIAKCGDERLRILFF